MAEYDGDAPECYDTDVCYDDDDVAAAENRRMKKIKFAASQHDDEGLETFGEVVVGRTDGKPAYAPVQGKVTAVKDRLVTYHQKRLAQDAAALALTAAEDAFDKERGLLELDIGSLATGVESEAKGSVTYITDAGFSVAGQKQSVGELPPPQNLVAKAGALEGTVKLRCKTVRGARSYIFQVATSANGPWTQIAVSPRASWTAVGLTSGTKYWFRVQVVGTSGPSGWSGDEGCMAP